MRETLKVVRYLIVRLVSRCGAESALEDYENEDLLLQGPHSQERSQHVGGDDEDPWSNDADDGNVNVAGLGHATFNHIGAGYDSMFDEADDDDYEEEVGNQEPGTRQCFQFQTIYRLRHPEKELFFCKVE